MLVPSPKGSERRRKRRGKKCVNVSLRGKEQSKPANPSNDDADPFFLTRIDTKVASNPMAISALEHVLREMIVGESYDEESANAFPAPGPATAPNAFHANVFTIVSAAFTSTAKAEPSTVRARMKQIIAQVF
ncbi:hypothetical protein SISNIDRAFT_491601 [Sistotremastrum niveocremeum HHB9708]|uniref:Uncharacterized protein n=1 Tax=Sistotremastrum niveocremeum HHB9708 TaxID=1314777 RepID=A0A164MLG7_9AGAM|nr:hypothetical protein SISNIDRAFT_491601 [Sistotremastrum niveocremeum HHB9708]